MPKITVLPHPEACPEGAAFEAETGANLARALIAHGVKVQHACEFNCACATCHVIVREGFDSLAEPSTTSSIIWTPPGAPASFPGCLVR